jgi:hypothetical protein
MVGFNSRCGHSVVPAWCAIAHGGPDPYAAADRFETVGETLCDKQLWWLWIPACAGMTAESV